MVAVALCLGLLGATTGCEPAELDQWLTERGRPVLTEPRRTQFAQFVTGLKAELARRDRFVSAIVPVDAARLGLSWRPGCPVGPEELRLISVSFMGFDGAERQGEIVVHRDVAPQVEQAFREMWNERFPINRMETPERFARPSDFDPGTGEYLEKPPQPDTVNDTYGFFCRRSTGGSSWSQHSYGKALDLNPVQNPYIRRGVVIPSNGVLDRRSSERGVLTPNSAPVRALKRGGFRWGGEWRTSKDYMHFSINGR